jgi:hypothetical protein
MFRRWERENLSDSTRLSLVGGDTQLLIFRHFWGNIGTNHHFLFGTDLPLPLLDAVSGFQRLRDKAIWVDNRVSF